MANLKISTPSAGINTKYKHIMLWIILAVIFARPFICALAFPYLNFVYSLALLICLGAYLIYKKPALTKIRSLIYPCILFSLALCVSVIFSQDRPNSLAQLYPYISGLGLFLIAASFSEKDKLLTIQTVMLAGFVISLLAIYQYLFGFKHVLDYLSTHKLSSPFILDYLQRKRVFFPFVTPGALGGYLAMIIPLFLINKNRIWFTLLVFTALLLTKSPNAFLSLFWALIIYFGVQGKLKKANILLLAGLFLLIIAVIIVRSAAPQEHLHPAFSAMMRLNYWQESLAIIKAHPFVGVGLGNFELQNSRYAHNAYLQIWAEMGLFGLFSLAWVIAAAFKICLKNLAQSLDKRQIAGLLAASAVFLAHNFLDFTFFLPEISLIWWVILGLALVRE
ncbi:MAG: O-antigen ligase family protein [Candidatus Omnitrophica bacterium]|nr:O-antigen ligase family protein [Candidatus Omnitrophota bacterium]MBU4419176.1 O-antigen ligase family protein [Candidatus Omnitrophota bacterium]MBU4468527.1 O-antigen ligase family protein [Candidatus Omnitrophota bacterium]MCG2707989.1 O-antigen ligase family protein [Candidatus Omnitrophota bacterium]